MLKNLSIAATSVLLLGGYVSSALGASIGAGNAYPVSDYVCKDGTKLAVRLMGEHASVSVNGKPAIELAAVGDKGTRFFRWQAHTDHHTGAAIVGRWSSPNVCMHWRLSVIAG
jgi:hypothetical protein